MANINFPISPSLNDTYTFGNKSWTFNGVGWVGGSVGGGSGTITSIVAGDNITVNNTDPANPIISSTGGVSASTSASSVSETNYGTVQSAVDNIIALKVDKTTTINGLDLTVNRNLVESIGFAMSDATTDITAGIKVPCAALPYNFTITGVRAQVGKAAVGSLLLTLDAKKNGTSIFTTKPTFDSTETVTETAATPYALTTSTIAALTSDTIELSVTQAGGVTTAAQNLTFFFIGYKTI